MQGELESTLQSVLKQFAPVVLAGRTDAGVHATGQVFRFSTENAIPAERVALALNAKLPRDIRVSNTRLVDERFHPRFSATGRIYGYRIDDNALSNPLLRHYAGRVVGPLNVDAMRIASEALIGRMDFAAWQSAGSPTKTTVREVRRIEIARSSASASTCGWLCEWGAALIGIEIEADAFLYQMVRNLVGALIAAGRQELTKQDLQRLTQGRDRTQCPPPAPPQGLCLMQVNY